MTEDNTRTGERYLIQLSIKQDSFMFNTWDYVESAISINYDIII